MEKNLDNAIRNFYSNNGIQSNNYTDSMETAYLCNKRYDMRISYPRLKDRVGEWIVGFEQQDRGYFYELLEKFTYITEDALTYRIYNLNSCLYDAINKLGIEVTEVLFVLIESDRGIKSGADEISVNLWTVNRVNDLKKEQIITSFSKVDKSKIEKAKVIIFMDDILATGFTMRQQIDSFFAKYKDVCVGNKHFYFTSILATKNAVKYIEKKMREKNINIMPFYQEEQFICNAFKGDYIFGGETVRAVERIVQKYEEIINKYDNVNEDKSFSMGFRQCKLLLAFHYETPNNTLCNFWKTTDRNNPVFERSGYIRPNIENLKKRKKHMKENAYLYNSLNRGKSI